MLNIHPALLPQFKGLDTHRRALEAGVKQHGATVHFVVPEMDAGPIVAQVSVTVREDDTEATLAARVLEVEHRIYPQALARVGRRPGKPGLLVERRKRPRRGQRVIFQKMPAPTFPDQAPKAKPPVRAPGGYKYRDFPRNRAIRP